MANILSSSVIAITAALFIIESVAQESIVEIECPHDDDGLVLGEYSLKLTEGELARFADEIARTDANWHKLSCGMSIAEANSIVWLVREPEYLRERSQTMPVYIVLGERRLVFLRDKLISTRGPTTIAQE